MLIGEYNHALDQKGRINFPSRLREELGNQFMIVKGLDECLCAYPMEEWQRVQEKLRELPSAQSREITRFLFAGAAVAEPDKQGRILIPQSLRQYAGIEGDVVVVGAFDRVEIWNAERWQGVCERMTSGQVAEAMEKLGL